MSGQTRPDIAFDFCQLGTNFKYSDDKDIKCANKIIAHLKQEPVQITYQNLGNECNLKLSIFADASHGSLKIVSAIFISFLFFHLTVAFQKQKEMFFI